METTVIPLPPWLFLCIVVSMFVVIVFCGTRLIDNAWNNAKRTYHGMLMTKIDLIEGSPYEVLGIGIGVDTENKELKFPFAQLKGKKHPGDKRSERFDVDFALKDVTDEKGNLRVKAGDIIWKTPTGKIEVMSQSSSPL